MTTKITRAEFDALLARAGLALGEERAAEIYRAWTSLEMLLEHVRAPLPVEAEPAIIYDLARDAT